MNKKKWVLIGICILLPLVMGVLLYVIINLLNNDENGLSSIDIICLFYQYCSYVLTIVLAVVVYNQNERVNQLEQLSYDYYIGIKNIDSDFSFNQFFVEAETTKSDEYTITQNFSNNSLVNFVSLDVSSGKNKSINIVAVDLITKNKLLITEVNIEEIKVSLYAEGKEQICRTLRSSSGIIRSCFDDNSIIPLAIGFVSDYKSDELELLTLDFKICLKDQKGKDHDFLLKGEIICHKHLFYLSSSATYPL